MLLADVVLTDSTVAAVTALLAALSVAVGVLFHSLVRAYQDRISDLIVTRDKLTERWLRAGVPPGRPDDPRFSEEEDAGGDPVGRVPREPTR